MDDLIAAIEVSNNSKELDENLLKLFDQRNNNFVEDMTKVLYKAASMGARLGNPKRLNSDEVEDEG